jgi:ABC-type transport system substrate-binding protein
MKRALLLALLVACGAPDRDPKWRPAGATVPRHGGTLTVAMKDQIRTLDPAIAYDEASFYGLVPLFATLVTYEPHGTGLVPDLAERWELEPDGVTYRFHLRDRLAYADGSPIVAGDIKYAMERALTTPDSPFGPFLVDVAGAQDVMEV